MAVITVRSLSKTIGFRRILHDLSFELHPGQLTAVTGKNGAGKTTLLKLMAGLSPKTAGTISGIAAGDVGYVGHQPMVYSALTAAENLAFFGRLYNNYDRTRISHLLDYIGLRAAQDLQGSMLSRGMLQRLSLGRLLVQDPRLCLLDEPFTGLDRQGQNWLSAVLQDLLADGRMVMVVSHHLPELDPLPYRQLHLEGGRIR